jgi:CheY-like chemotaxis protein
MNGVIALVGIDSDLLLELSNVLQKSGLRILSVRDLPGLVDGFRPDQLAIVAVDLDRLSNSDRILIDRLADDPAGPGIVAIGTPAPDGSRIPAAARRYGVHAFVPKPVDPGAFVRAVGSLAELGYGTPDRSPRVLLIDDSRTIRAMVGGYLKRGGYHAIVRDVWEDAIDDPETLGVDLVVTDIFMPGMGGVEGIRRVREQWRQVPVLAMSAGLEDQMSPGTTLRAAEIVGADVTIAKPIVEGLFLSAVRELLAD